MSNQTEPKLAPPGAGVPYPVKLVLRFIIAPFVAAKSDWDQNFSSLDKLQKKILMEAKALSESELQKKVLIPPQRGLEDSSRYWSIQMTLEHLLIVGTQMREVIVSLSEGVVPPVVADTAKVKPLGQKNGIETISEFQAFADTIISELNSRVKNKTSAKKFLHPWFGYLTALQWQWVMSAHNRIHLQQIRAIKKGL